jgi:SPP1 gp7 family putative phage head morphogenesis protein
MTRRFIELSKVITISIVTNDCFGLTPRITSQQMTPAARRAFEFSTSTEKVEAFMQWLQKQVDAGLLDVGVARQLGTALNESWLNLYILDSYKRGIIRARQELNKAGIQVPNLDSDEAINLALGTPLHMDRIALLYSRVYTELKGITEAMDTLISRILAQGMIDGDGPALLARKISEAIRSIGINRATILARTEVIRAHHIATIQEYRNWGLEGVIVLAEWSTAGDDRVCPICEGLEGKIFTLDEIEGQIPRHPQCRCIALPYIEDIIKYDNN